MATVLSLLAVGRWGGGILCQEGCLYRRDDRWWCRCRCCGCGVADVADAVVDARRRSLDDGGGTGGMGVDNKMVSLTRRTIGPGADWVVRVGGEPCVVPAQPRRRHRRDDPARRSAVHNHIRLHGRAPGRTSSRPARTAGSGTRACQGQERDNPGCTGSHGAQAEIPTGACACSYITHEASRWQCRGGADQGNGTSMRGANKYTGRCAL